MSASPARPVTGAARRSRRGWPTGSPTTCSARAQASGPRTVSRRTNGCGMMPDSTLRDGRLPWPWRGSSRARPPVAHRGRVAAAAPAKRSMQILRQLAQSVALAVEALRSYRRGAPGRPDPAAELPARGAARGTRAWRCAFRYMPGQRSGRGRRRLLRGAGMAGPAPDRHRRRAGALAARGDRDGRAPARAARLRQRGTRAAGDHRPGQRGAAALPPGHHRHACAWCCSTRRPASSRS